MRMYKERFGAFEYDQEWLAIVGDSGMGALSYRPDIERDRPDRGLYRADTGWRRPVI